MDNKKICFIFNQAPLYVESAYTLFDKEFNAKWCFGSNDTDIKDMDLTLLKDVTIYKTNRWGAGFYTLKGISEVANDKSIDAYIIIGEPKLVDAWTLPLKIKRKNPRAKILYWSHGWYGKESRIKAIVKKLFFNLADGVLLYGNYARGLMIKEGFSPDTLYTIHNALHHSRQVKLRNSITPSNIYSEHFDNNYPTIIFIGRLTKVKQLDLVINALSLLKEKGRKCNLVFVGDGSERNSLGAIVKEKCLEDSVWFYGACYDERQNAELIYNADLCVAPGNIGLTAMHSLVFGCPAISHNDFKWQMPEFEAIHPGVTGDFFERNNVDALAGTIEKWFIEHSDRREEVRLACYNEIDNYWTPEYELQVLKKALHIDC